MTSAQIILLISGCLIASHTCATCTEGSERVELGRLVLRCQGGKYVGSACIHESGQRVNVNSRAVFGPYEMECKAVENGLVLQPIACLNNGRRYRSGETVTINNFWFTCDLSPTSAKPAPSGCIDSQGQQINIGDQFTTDGFVLSCVKEASVTKIMPVYCIDPSGRRVSAGQAYESGMFWYLCKSTGQSGVLKELKGCVANGRRLENGEKYKKDGFVFQCVVSQGSPTTSASHTIAGCTSVDTTNGREMEHNFGERWVASKFVMECQKHGNRVGKQVVQCIHSTGLGDVRLDVGCARKINSELIMCSKKVDGTVFASKTSSNGNESDTTAVRNLNLNFC